MPSLRSLLKDTVIYGLSSIIGRFLNYLLVPIYTAKLSAESGGYGVITNMYAYTALLLVILTYGMETTFFRFSNKEGEDPQRVYATILTSVATTSVLFMLLVLAFLHPLSGAMGYGDHPSYVWVMAATVAVDAFQCIPFAYLRYQKKAIKFAALKLLFIVLNILLNLLFFVVLPATMGTSIEVGYAFYINLVCTALITLFFYRELTAVRWGFDRQLMRRMLSYSWPILVLGIAGILNQTADKILFPYIYPYADSHEQLGIYSASAKIAMIMAMITQAFRYAYEPFVFGQTKEKDNKVTYAKAMEYFVLFTLLAFLLVMAGINLLRNLIAQDYWSGLSVVPIVMVAEIMMGIYFNLSVWYKLIDKTIWGAWFSGIGCVVLISVNVLFVPRYGFMACAWAGVAGYGTAMLLSYLVGQRYYPIAYPLGRLFAYTLLAALLFLCITWSNAHLSLLPALALNTLLLLPYAALVAKKLLTKHPRHS